MMLENLDPIRQHCPARAKEEHHIVDSIFEDQEFWNMMMMDHQSQEHDHRDEVDEQAVDAFFNAECFDEDNRNLMQLLQVGPDHRHHHHRSSDYGLQIVHLLLGCAEAVGCQDSQVADSILTQISPLVSPSGDSLQRVSYYFTTGLKSRLALIQNGTFIAQKNRHHTSEREASVEAFRLLNQATPYLKFGFMAANEAICQAVSGKDFLHVLDLGSGDHHLQWPSLIRNLASRAEGPPKLLRITSIIEDQEVFISNEFHQNMQIVLKEASSIGIPVKFHRVAIKPSQLTKENLGVKEGEELIVNCIMHLHKLMKESGGSVREVLQAVKRLNPSLLTVVEQDANHNGPFFLGRFLESLHYYSAIFDSLEAMLPRESAERMKMETYHYAEEIKNILASEGLDRVERHLRMDQWRRQLGRAGFQVQGFKSTSQAKMLLSEYGCDGFTLSIENGCLLLGWKGRPIMLASSWKVA